MHLKCDNQPHARLSSTLTLTNLTEEQSESVKESLTFENPDYKNALRYSGYGATTLPKYLNYYVQRGSQLIVPAGFDYRRLGITRICDTRVKVPVEVPPFILTLRDDQERAARAFLRSNKPRGSQCGMIQMPTGKGKTVMGIYLAYALKQRTLVIVHKSDLVRGWKKDAEIAFDGKIKVGIIGGGKRVIGDFITVATVQTLNKLSDEEFAELQDAFGFVIVDECHHIAASSYDLVNNLNARYKLGLTATPERKDGLSHLMTDYLGDFCFQLTSAPNDKDILPVDIIMRDCDAFVDPVCSVVKNDQNKVLKYQLSDLYSPATKKLEKDQIRLSEIADYRKRPRIPFTDMLSVVFSRKEFNNMVIKDMIYEIEAGHSCIAFFNLKEHCSLYYYKLINAGVPKELIQIYNGDCSAKQLEECLQRAESKDALMTLTTFSKSTEGTNVNAWEVGFMVGSTNDGKNAEQAVGRIRRLAPNKLKRARMYDYCLKNVPMLARHTQTRVKRYQKLGFRFVDNSQNTPKIFRRGYKRY